MQNSENGRVAVSSAQAKHLSEGDSGSENRERRSWKIMMRGQRHLGRWGSCIDGRQLRFRNRRKEGKTNKNKIMESKQDSRDEQRQRGPDGMQTKEEEEEEGEESAPIVRRPLATHRRSDG
jgi:hypothetical protein